MNPVWCAFACGIFVGAVAGMFLLAIFQLNTERKFKRFIKGGE